MKAVRQNSYTVQISFVPSDSAAQAPKSTENIHVKFPLGTPLPHVGDKIVLDDIFYTVKSRALMLSNTVIRDAFWNLLIENVDL